MSDWPILRMIGGPHGKKLETTIDGVPVPRISRIEIVADATDAIRVTTYQFLSVDFELEIVPSQPKVGWLCRVRWEDTSAEVRSYSDPPIIGKGLTRRAALLDAASRLPEEEPSEPA